jgi:hypothetical protein
VTRDSANPKKPTVKVQPTYVTGTKHLVKLDVRTSEPGVLIIEPAGPMGGLSVNATDLGSLRAMAQTGVALPELPWYIKVSNMTRTSTTLTMDLPADLEDGTYHFLALAFDRAGNLPGNGEEGDIDNVVTFFDVIVDRHAPDQPEITSNDTALAGSNYQLTGDVSDDGSGVSYVLVNNTKVKVTDGSFTYTKKLTTKVGEVVPFTIIVVDKAGYKSEKYVYEVTTAGPT